VRAGVGAHPIGRTAGSEGAYGIDPLERRRESYIRAVQEVEQEEQGRSAGGSRHLQGGGGVGCVGLGV